MQIFTEKIRISPTKLWRVCSWKYALRPEARHPLGFSLAVVGLYGSLDRDGLRASTKTDDEIMMKMVMMKKKMMIGISTAI